VASGESPGAETDVKRPEPVSAVTAVTDDDSGQHATAASPPATQPKDVSILKQINKVNDDGSYTFGYEASDGSFKVETRDVAGNVKGMFGFVDDVGRLKRVSYSASNSSGFQAAGSESPRPSPDPTATSVVQTTAGRRNKKDDGGGDESDGGKSAAVGVKKVLVSKRPVVVAAAPELRTETENEVDDQRRRGGNDLRRQLPRNDDGDAPDVYGVHGRSSIQESGPVSPVVSALMSELMPVRSYGRPTGPPPPPPQSPPIGHEDAVSSRRAAQELQEDEYEDGQQYNIGPTTVQYRRRRPPAALYQQRASYPTMASTAAYQQQRPVAYLAPLPQRGPSLVALRDELMELILSFVQARVSQLVSVAPYPMPYQQPNYYVPNYYQGPRMPGPTTEQAQESSPIVTQTLKDGLIRMLLSTSPRYDPDRISERSTTRLAYRSTSTQPTPVRSVQIVSGDNDDDERMVDSRPVTTETPD